LFFFTGVNEVTPILDENGCMRTFDSDAEANKFAKENISFPYKILKV